MNFQSPNDLTTTVGMDPNKLSPSTMSLIQSIIDRVTSSPHPEQISTEDLTNELTPSDEGNLRTLYREFSLTWIPRPDTSASCDCLGSRFIPRP
jgi:hypothetical protein